MARLTRSGERHNRWLEESSAWDAMREVREIARTPQGRSALKAVADVIRRAEFKASDKSGGFKELLDYLIDDLLKEATTTKGRAAIREFEKRFREIRSARFKSNRAQAGARYY